MADWKYNTSDSSLTLDGAFTITGLNYTYTQQQGEESTGESVIVTDTGIDFNDSNKTVTIPDSLISADSEINITVDTDNYNNFTFKSTSDKSVKLNFNAVNISPTDLKVVTEAGDDTINITASDENTLDNVTVNSGAGADKIIVNAASATIDAGTGEDAVTSVYNVVSGGGTACLLESGNKMEIETRAIGSNEGVSGLVENYDPTSGATARVRLNGQIGYEEAYLKDQFKRQLTEALMPETV